MNSASCKALVVGATGQLGRALCAQLRERGHCVFTTTRRGGICRAGESFLDLVLPLKEWPPLPFVDVVFLCAGVSSVVACEESPAESSFVNVEQIPRLARMCHREGARIVLPSTSYVFSRDQEPANVQTPVNPQTAYGRQKRVQEDRIRAMCANTTVVRLSKVVSAPQALFSEWQARLARGQEVTAFGDLSIAPVSLQYAAHMLCEAGFAESPGLVHVSARECMTYVDVAGVIAEQLQADPALVVEGASGTGPALSRHACVQLENGSTIPSITVDPPSAHTTILGALAARE